MTDPILEGILEEARDDFPRINADSDVVELHPEPGAGLLPRSYVGLFRGVEHFVRTDLHRYDRVARPIPFRIAMGEDYARSVDPNLQFRVVSTDADVVHPNIKGGIVCLGAKFRPGTKLRSVVEQFYRIASGRVAATSHAFDGDAAEFFLSHLEAVRALHAEPLWKRPLAARAHVEKIAPQAGGGS